MIDFMQEALYSFHHNKVRTALSAFSVFWGVLILIILLASGNGLRNGVYHDFGSDVVDFISIRAGTSTVDYQGNQSGRLIGLTIEDVVAIKENIKDVRFCASENINNTNIFYQQKSVTVDIFGVSTEYFKIKEDLKIQKGRGLNPLDEEKYERVAIVGNSIAKRIFGSVENSVGKLILINDTYIKIIGAFNDKANHGRDSDRIYIPSTTYKQMFGGDSVDAIWLRPIIGGNGFEVEANTINLLKDRHGLSREDSAITSFNIAGQIQNVNNLFKSINIFLWFVGLGTLAAGVVGVSNIMVIAVNERRKEIGIRRAVGATPTAIVVSFLCESVMLTGLSGAAGLVLGMTFIKLISLALDTLNINMSFFYNPTVDIKIALSAIFILIISGVLAGLLPAIHAVKLCPIDSIKYDE